MIMGQVKNLIKDLENKIDSLYFNERVASKEEWQNKEMFAVTVAIFGGDFEDYWKKLGKEKFNKKVCELIYCFQNKIYNAVSDKQLLQTEYECAYTESKNLLNAYQ